VDRIAEEQNCYWIGMGDYCLSEDTEILTDHGWRNIDNLQPDDLAVVYDPERQNCHFEPTIKKWLNPPDSRKMVLLSSGHVNALMTKNHRILLSLQCRQHLERL